MYTAQIKGAVYAEFVFNNLNRAYVPKKIGGTDMFKKALSLAIALIMVLTLGAAFASCGDLGGDDKDYTIESPLPAKELTSTVNVPSDFKIGFIFLHDENSTYDANFINAAKTVKSVLNLTDDQVLFKKNIGEDDSCYNAAKELANAGCKVIFADSFGHEDYMLQAAKEFPNVQFCHATGTKAHTEKLSNYHNAFASIYEGRYLAGIAAGMKINEMIKNGTKINGKTVTADNATMGYVGAFTYAEVVSGLTSFYLGAKSVCPTVKMKVQFTGSWYDQTMEGEAATALIAQGCVLISQHADSMGAPTACEAAGVPNVSYNGSTVKNCPDTFIVSSAINWAPYLLYISECVIKGEAIATDWCGGIAEGSVVLSDINGKAAAAGTKEALDEAVKKFKAGTLKVFNTDTFTVDGKKVESFKCEGATEVVKDGFFAESVVRSAPYFEFNIDGIEFLNTKF